MTYAPHGKHLIAGEWVATPDRFQNEPVSGAPDTFALGTVALVNRAAEAAEAAFWSYGYASVAERAALLRTIADEIEVRGAAITEIGCRESGLPTARLEGERGRTTGQLRLFADHIEKGDYLDRRFDAAQPDRQPAPRPEIRLMQRPVGPVAVFGASNFPLAFSTAGGDTAAALAAGCPVVVKGHSAHPGTGEIVAEAILAAISKLGMDPGVFSLVQGGNREVGAALVTHPLIKAVGFTGSLAGGRALFDLCAGRAEPIPFFGELGSVNPMFVLPAAVGANASALGAGWAASLTMGAGQFCTNPGIAVVIAGSDADDFVAAARDALAKIPEQVMLTEGIARAYHAGQARLKDRETVNPVLETVSAGRSANPNLYETTASQFLADHALAEEVFGPLGLVVRVEDGDEMRRVAQSLQGQLTVTLHMDDDDMPLAKMLLPVLERKAGRVLVNGFPTGVEVVDSMVHGGPYPASTNFGATSVGTLSIRRFLRPVSYQNFPAALLPEGVL
ncbi:aldehyde dehydrogenase (NADP(+)) [Sulfitobacter pseudonitzschiae]|uniref:Aldehyde dehydrogenase (NADP(+)) n=1 Tax=Pseudosulfitobacter pseudonitzschiae TaxID=1402135 RepID=A0A9Q2NR23_9RHOB|nr:aldehyde dehydrogenase (NADP(+)) [Pseudosulfitobacter pseudonitzschiae]MBM2293074.1 aldehyde dehydrogenase (NADP(+)) [Pseudosulfitobacter pseudonitzschiae]MBM2297638.1 aldehyde dehydrogenase (NADP(+)) [Pseudosulfitobacter pseudonitzschiae]MBM2302552.1 aldehyde dehydrogenase (NADP(+)) [Pseudosulfitobacter pseudonitzschiae]MBM2312458.1 aldehyde dehydrogenase (NADP(+)) [Pseudosulfitobacter pseudonitzschiae]MBM2317248.1 aldehyde dehydrogenase (NADP(+)) [Pseudosulfitobacter pseudonitzschiae]